VVDDNVADMDADAERDLLRLGHRGVALRHAPLDLNGTAEGVHYARELNQHAVSGGLHDPTAVFGDLGVYESPAVRLELCKRALLVNAHQPAVSSDISRQDGCEASLYALGSQSDLQAQLSGLYHIPPLYRRSLNVMGVFNDVG
jgi:hypothetical protein